MNRRVIGSGAIVCSAVVLWAQPAPEASTDDCVNDINDAAAASCSTTLTGRIHRTITPMISGAQGLLSLQWSGTGANQLPSEMETVYDNLLKQAQTAANSDRLASALNTVAGVPKNSQHYARAQQLQENWAQELIQRATNRCQQGDMTNALAMLDAIPSGSQRYARAAELRDRWTEQASLFNQARTARAAGDWSTVVASLEALKGTPLYNSQPVQQLLQQAISRNFQPNAALMQLASASSPQPATPPPAPAAMPIDTAPAPVESAGAPTLEIDLAQAMEWAQPSQASIASVPSAGIVPISSPRSLAAQHEMSSATSPSRATPFGKNMPPIVLKYLAPEEMAIEPQSEPLSAEPAALAE